MNTRLVQSILLVIAAVIFTAILFLPTWLDSQTSSSDSDTYKMVTQPNCVPYGRSCRAEFGKHAVTLEITAETLKALIPLTFNLNSENMQIQEAELQLQGKEMYMGVNNSSFHQLTPNKWQSISELSVCTTGTMRWQAVLNLKTTEGRFQAIFEFDAK